MNRYADMLRYDRDRGVVMVRDPRAPPHTASSVALAGVEEVAAAIAARQAGGPPVAHLGGYGLVVAARACRGYPTEARRGALIQAAERLRQTRPANHALRRMIERALACADTALLEGAGAEEALIDFVEAEVARSDRVAERCGRHAAELLAEGDRILTCGFGGPALIWMLSVARGEQNNPVQLLVAEAQPGLEGARITAHLAHATGAPVTLLADAALEAAFAAGMVDVVIAGAEQIALDGSVAASLGTCQSAVLARRHRVPFYALGYDGPEQDTPTGAELLADASPSTGPALAGAQVAPEGVQLYCPAFDVTPPELVNAIVTYRGVYRPEMIGRFPGGVEQGG